MIVTYQTETYTLDQYLQAVPCIAPLTKYYRNHSFSIDTEASNLIIPSKQFRITYASLVITIGIN